MNVIGQVWGGYLSRVLPRLAFTHPDQTTVCLLLWWKCWLVCVSWRTNAQLAEPPTVISPDQSLIRGVPTLRHRLPRFGVSGKLLVKAAVQFGACLHRCSSLRLRSAGYNLLLVVTPALFFHQMIRASHTRASSSVTSRVSGGCRTNGWCSYIGHLWERSVALAFPVETWRCAAATRGARQRWVFTWSIIWVNAALEDAGLGSTFVRHHNFPARSLYPPWFYTSENRNWKSFESLHLTPSPQHFPRANDLLSDTNTICQIIGGFFGDTSCRLLKS